MLEIHGHTVLAERGIGPEVPWWAHCERASHASVRTAASARSSRASVSPYPVVSTVSVPATADPRGAPPRRGRVRPHHSCRSGRDRWTGVGLCRYYEVGMTTVVCREHRGHERLTSPRRARQGRRRGLPSLALSVADCSAQFQLLQLGRSSDTRDGGVADLREVEPGLALEAWRWWSGRLPAWTVCRPLRSR